MEYGGLDMAEYIEREAVLKKRFNMYMEFCGTVPVVAVDSWQLQYI